MTTQQASQPTTYDASQTVSAFIDRLGDTYDISEVIIFGSRARADHGPNSDLDLAIVLNGTRGNFLDVKLDMAGLAFDVLMETGVLVQALPLWDDDLNHPEKFPNPTLIRSIARDGIRFG